METISSNQNEDLSITDNLEERGKIYVGGRMEISWHLSAGHFWSDGIDSRIIPKYLE